jgi:hypothetical protein
MHHKVAEKVRAVPSVSISAYGPRGARYDRVVACCIRVAASFNGSMKLLVPLFKIGRVSTLTYLKKGRLWFWFPFIWVFGKAHVRSLPLCAFRPLNRTRLEAEDFARRTWSRR